MRTETAVRHLQVALVVLRGCLRIQLLFVCNSRRGNFSFFDVSHASLLPRERRSTAHTAKQQHYDAKDEEWKAADSKKSEKVFKLTSS